MPPDPRSGTAGRIVVAAQWDAAFMAEAAQWRDGPCRAVCRDGADHGRGDLFAALRAGDTLVYLGHATPTAWLGFRGIRADHIPRDMPRLGCVIALTCHGTAPGSLGAAWHARGASAAVFGPTGSIGKAEVLGLAARLRGAMGRDALRCAGDLRASLPRGDFALLGDARQPLARLAVHR